MACQVCGQQATFDSGTLGAWTRLLQGLTAFPAQPRLRAPLCGPCVIIRENIGGLGAAHMGAEARVLGEGWGRAGGRRAKEVCTRHAYWLRNKTDGAAECGAYVWKTREQKGDRRSVSVSGHHMSACHPTSGHFANLNKQPQKCGGREGELETSPTETKSGHGSPFVWGTAVRAPTQEDTVCKVLLLAGVGGVWGQSCIAGRGARVSLPSRPGPGGRATSQGGRALSPGAGAGAGAGRNMGGWEGAKGGAGSKGSPGSEKQSSSAASRPGCSVSPRRRARKGAGEAGRVKF